MIANPLLERPESARFKLAGSHAPQLLSVHQPGSLKNLKVLYYRGESNSEGLGQPRNRRRLLDERVNNGTPRWIAERVKQTIEID